MGLKLKCRNIHYNSLFLASSHNFISLNFCAKYLKIPTMIAVRINQTQEDNSNPTMSLPLLDTYLVPQQIPEKMSKKTLEFGK
jgi:hypothetical protein